MYVDFKKQDVQVNTHSQETSIDLSPQQRPMNMRTPLYTKKGPIDLEKYEKRPE